MSNSKPLPTFTYDLLCYLNRDQLERFSIVCRSLKNFIERYFNSKPCRVFDFLEIRGGSYALINKEVQWHPNRYCVRSFLAGQKTSSEDLTYHSFAEMRPYFGATVRIKSIFIHVGGDSTYAPDHIKEMEALSYFWRNGEINIENAENRFSRIVAEVFQPILNSATILQCHTLLMCNAQFSLKDYKVLFAVKVIQIYGEDSSNYWSEFLEQPGVKPVVVLYNQQIDNALGRLKQNFSSAVSPNAFKSVFVYYGEVLPGFRVTNKTSGEVLELKNGVPFDYKFHSVRPDHFSKHKCYTLERFGI